MNSRPTEHRHAMTAGKMPALLQLYAVSFSIFGSVYAVLGLLIAVGWLTPAMVSSGSEPLWPDHWLAGPLLIALAGLLGWIGHGLKTQNLTARAALALVTAGLPAAGALLVILRTPADFPGALAMGACGFFFWWYLYRKQSVRTYFGDA